MNAVRLSCVVLFHLVLCFAGQWAAAQYAVTDLGTLPGYGDSYATGINDSGQIVGALFTPAVQQAFLYSNGTMADLGPLLGNPTWSFGRAINASGQITGNFAAGMTDHAFVYSNRSFTDLGTLPGDTQSFGYGINASGQVVGYSASGTAEHAFVYSNGTMTSLFPSVQRSRAYSINSTGAIVGATSTGGYDHAVGPLLPQNDNFWTGDSVAYRMNNNGQIVGAYGVNGPDHAFLYSNGSVIDLGTLGGTFTEAVGINDNGFVVGDSRLGGLGSWTHAFIYASGQMTDLNTLIPADSGWMLTTANHINNFGMIVGSGINPSGEPHAFLLTPTPEPSMVAVLAIGAACLPRRRAAFPSNKA